MPTPDNEQAVDDGGALRQVADLLRHALERTPKSQREVAEDARVSTRTIYQLKQERRDASLESIADSIARLAIVLEGDKGGCEKWLKAAKIHGDHAEIIKRAVSEVRGGTNISETKAHSPEHRLEELLAEPAVRPRLACALYVSPPEAVGNSRIEETIAKLVDKGEGMWFALFIPYFSPRQLSDDSKEIYYGNKRNLRTIYHDIYSPVLNITSNYKFRSNNSERIQVFRPNTNIVGFQSYPYIPNQSRPFYTREYFDNGDIESDIEVEMETIQSWSYNREDDRNVWYTFGPNKSSIHKQYYRDYFYDVINSWESSISNDDKKWYNFDDAKRESIWERVEVDKDI